MANELLLNGSFNNKDNWLETPPTAIVSGFDGTGIRIGDDQNYGAVLQHLYPQNAESSVEVVFQVRLEESTDILVGIAKPAFATYGVRVFQTSERAFYVRGTDPEIQFQNRELGAGWYEVKFKVPSPIPLGTSFNMNGKGLIDNASCTEIENPDLLNIVRSNWLVIVGVCAVGVGGYLVYRYYKKRKNRSEAYTNVVPTV